MCFVNWIRFNWETLFKFFKNEWPHNAFALLMLSCELLIIFGLPCTIQSTPCEHWTTVHKIVFCNNQWKASKLVYVKINNGGAITFVDSDILDKTDVPWPTKQYIMIKNKTVKLIWSIFNYKKQVIIFAQTSVDCLRASKLVTLGYILANTPVLTLTLLHNFYQIFALTSPINSYGSLLLQNT